MPGFQHSVAIVPLSSSCFIVPFPLFQSVADDAVAVAHEMRMELTVILFRLKQWRDEHQTEVAAVFSVALKKKVQVTETSILGQRHKRQESWIQRIQSVWGNVWTRSGVSLQIFSHDANTMWLFPNNLPRIFSYFYISKFLQSRIVQNRQISTCIS